MKKLLSLIIVGMFIVATVSAMSITVPSVKVPTETKNTGSIVQTSVNPEVIGSKLNTEKNSFVNHEVVNSSFFEPLTVSIGEDRTLSYGEHTNLYAYVTGFPSSITWYTTSGTLANRNGYSTGYAAPYNNCIVTVTCVVRDYMGRVASDQMYITIVPSYGPVPGPMPGENRNPIVSLSGRAVVTSGELISVTANAYDPEGDPVSYDWYATEGRILNPSANSITVTTPTLITSPRTMVVIVTVRDDRGGITSAFMQFTVMPVVSGYEPVITMPNSLQVRAGESISICPTITSPRGLPLRYVWYSTQGTINNKYVKDAVFTAPNNPGTEVICSLIAVDTQEGTGCNAVSIKII